MLQLPCPGQHVFKKCIHKMFSDSTLGKLVKGSGCAYTGINVMAPGLILLLARCMPFITYGKRAILRAGTECGRILG